MGSGGFEHSADSRIRWVALAAVVLCAAWIIWINPIGFLGGGADDTQYLKAVRCWVAAGEPCLAQSHWASRWPIIAPIALVTGLLGESRTTVALAPFLYACATLLLMIFVGNRLFGRPAGFVAAAALVLTPSFAIEMLQPAADGIELSWLIACFAAALAAYDRRSGCWALAAGVALGIAAQTRDTSLAMFPIAIAAIGVLARGERRFMLWFVPGMLLPVAAEALIYWIATGDPLWRFRLSLGHVRISSTELPEGFDTSQSPLFNPTYIAAWSREARISLFWPVDPWLNLLASYRLGPTLWASILLALLFTGRFLESAARRRLAWLLGGALLYSALLIYGFAVDPKARMFFVLCAVSALAIGALIARAWRGDGRLGVVTIVVVFIPFVSLIVALQNESRSSERAAAKWIRQFPRQIEIDRDARAYLMLVRTTDQLPDRGSGRPLLIAKAERRCNNFATPEAGKPPKTIVIAKQRMGGIEGINARSTGEMCLLRYLPG